MWYSIVSPGSTGLRNLALSMVRKNTDFGVEPDAMMHSTPAVCAMPSIISTPGNTGFSGKWPWKCGSLMVTFLMPMPLSSPLMSIDAVDHEKRIAVRQHLPAPSRYRPLRAW